MCKCGCNTCDLASKSVLLNENVAPTEILSEGLKHHINNNKPLTEHLYRAGSRAYFDLWGEARSLYSRGILEISGEDDLAILTETDLGHFGLYEGKRVPLDFIMEEEIDQLDKDEISFGADLDRAKGIVSVIAFYKGDRIGTLRLTPNKKLNGFTVDGIVVYDDYRGKKQDTNGDTFKVSHLLYKIANDNLDRPVYSDLSQSPGAKKAWEELVAQGLATKEGDRYKMTSSNLDEAKKKKKKKNPPLNKPKRGGSKAYYVYVRDPKTKKIKKVSFGSGGLRAKINNRQARQAFAKRHKCSTKTDKTKAGYWSCRLPRYAKLLGLKSNFSGFW